MKIRVSSCYLLVALTLFNVRCIYAQTGTSSDKRHAAQAAMDRDLLEVTVPQLEQLYRSQKYTVAQVVRWYIARIEKYNGIYRAVQNLDAPGALATAAREDAEARAGLVFRSKVALWHTIIRKGSTESADPSHAVTPSRLETVVTSLKPTSCYLPDQLPRKAFERSLSGRRFRVLGVGSVPVRG